MGRPKIDYSKVETSCLKCPKKHVMLRKGLCSPCYMKDRHERLHAGDGDYNSRRRKQAKKWNSENPERYKANKKKWHLSSSYAITPEFYDKLLAEQNGVCKICGNGEIGSKRLSVDHCHNNGHVRGLLCRKCNFLVGNIETSSNEVVLKAIEYINDWRNKKMSIKRLTTCQEVTPKGSSPCHNEAKAFCTECKAGICANHADGHEKFTCPEIKVPDPEPIPLIAVEPVTVESIEPVKEDEKKGWFK